MKSNATLTYLSPMLHFYTLEEVGKLFSGGGIEMENWTKMG